MLDTHTIKKDFPILSKKIHDTKPLVYLDSAATSQKPQIVIDSISNYYQNHNANVHRGIHQLGDESTRLFLQARKTIASFFGADDDELILVQNTTEAINMVALTWGDQNIYEGDVVLTTEMEHHSNLIPWQVLCKKKHAELLFIPVTKDGLLDYDSYDLLLKRKPKLVAVTHISNTLGTVNDLSLLVEKAHNVGAKVLVDGAQSAPHLPINFHKLNVDFFAFSGHKMYGPMGIGGLLVRKSLLDTMEPFLVGGGMIDEVTIDTATYTDLPDRFIAGTPDVASAVGLASACTYLQSMTMHQIQLHDAELVSYALQKLSTMQEVTVVGPHDPTKRVGSVAFLFKDVHAHDVAQILDTEGVAVRSGHHCTMPLHTKCGWPATTRASFGIYTSKDNIDALVFALQKVKKVFVTT